MPKDPWEEYFKLLPDRIKAAFDAIDSKGHKDELGRAESAEFLTRLLVGRYINNPDSMVFNINAEWGFGKSFLVERWAKALKASGHPVVFYNAWENDFTDEPLLSFISHIEEELVPEGASDAITKAFSGVKSTAYNVIKSLPSILGKAVLSWALREGMTDLIAAISTDEKEPQADAAPKNEKGVQDFISISSPQIDSILKHHNTAKNAIKSFRENLKSFVASLEKNGEIAPLFIFVDELDRCKPDYAIRLLEVIKHLFEVEGVYFIISTDTDALAKACQAVYGPNYDGIKYLKRFFQQTYKLPEPSTEDYIKFLFDKYRLESFDRYKFPYDSKEKNPGVIITLNIAARAFKAGLRDIDQAMMLLRSLVDTWPYANMHVQYLILLVFMKVMNIEWVDKLAQAIKVESSQATNWDGYLLLKGKMDTSVTFGGKIGIRTLFEYYHNIRKQNAKIISRTINTSKGGLHRDILLSVRGARDPNSEDPLSILQYESLVDQAGHLIETETKP